MSPGSARHLSVVCRGLYKGLNSSLLINISSDSINTSASDDPERLKVRREGQS